MNCINELNKAKAEIKIWSDAIDDNLKYIKALKDEVTYEGQQRIIREYQQRH